MLEIAALIISVILNGLLGLLVYTKNPKSVTNQLFFMLTSIFIIWSVTNYFSDHPFFFQQLIWVRLVLFFAAPLCLLVFLTFRAFPSTTYKDSQSERRWAILYTLFVMALSLTPLVFSSLKVENGKSTPVPSAGIVFFGLLVLIFLGGGIWNLIDKYRHAEGKEKLQIRFVLLGLAGTFSLIFLTNFLLVVVFNNTSLVPLGPTYTLIFTVSLAYAIVRHRLFDIRRAAARGLGYVLTIGFLALAYSALVFGVSSLFLSGNTVNRTDQAINTLLALLMAFSFQSIKRFFDKLSSRIFYKDTYDPQQFLDELNQLLVGQVELARLIRGSIITIESHLKSDGSVFVIRKTAYVAERLISSTSSKFHDDDIKQILPLVGKVRQKVIVADHMEGDNLELGKQMNDRDMSIVVRLVVHLGAKLDSDIGEIVLGPKRNGDPYTKDDIQVLEIIANELVIAIQNALRFEEIENFNRTLQAKVDDATRKLRKVNERLKTLDETKDDFISMASHQLRTPLTSVKGYISMVLEEDAGKISKTQREMLGQAFFSSQRMVYLIADLLNVSRLKTGKFIIERSSVNLAAVIEQELSQLRETADSRQLTLKYDMPKNFPSVMLDETKTRQVIMNFADNAIYYTPAGGHITVKLLDNPTNIEMRVEDDGIGVPKSEQPHLFTKFYRAGNARKARPDGTGLGLYMAKKVIVAQGGSLLFESQEGKGSTFGFIFNKSTVAVPEPSSTPVKTAKK